MYKRQVFIDCMEHLKLQPWECIAFEDAAAGIEAVSYTHLDVYKRQVICMEAISFGEGASFKRA